MWGIKKISIRPKTPRKTHIFCIFKYSKFHFVGTLGGYAYSWIDIRIIGYFLTNADVSAYEFAWRVTEFVILFSNAIALTTLPQVSRWDADGETKKIEQLIENGVTASLFFVIPAFFGTVLLAVEILQFVFGPEYTIAGIVLVILMFEALFQAVHKVLSRVLLGMDKPSLAARATAVSILLNIILNIVFVVSYGLPGAAAATAISFMMNTALHGWFLSRYITISFNIFDIVKCVLSAIGMTTVLLFIQSNLAIVSLPLLMVVVAVGGSVYLIFAMAFSSIRDKIFDTLGQIIDHPVA
jgi:O-antigen/teichoic acid export membrane protein